MKLRLFAVILLGISLVSSTSVVAQTKSHRVLFALTSPDDADWQITIHNVHNLISGLAPEPVQVEVVAFGPGVIFLKGDSSEAAAIKELEGLHVRFVACGNAMKAHHLTQADMVPGTEVAPAGIVEVVRREEEGWTYIKAGR